MTAKFVITAFNPMTGARVELFRWARDAESGIRRAQSEAKQFAMDHLTDFKAEPVTAEQWQGRVQAGIDHDVDFQYHRIGRD